MVLVQNEWAAVQFPIRGGMLSMLAHSGQHEYNTGFTNMCVGMRTAPHVLYIHTRTC